MPSTDVLHRICSKAGGVVREGYCLVRNILNVLKVLDDIDKEANGELELVFKDESDSLLIFHDDRKGLSKSIRVRGVLMSPKRLHYRYDTRRIPGFTDVDLAWAAGNTVGIEVASRDAKPSELVAYVLGRLVGMKHEEEFKAERWEVRTSV